MNTNDNEWAVSKAKSLPCWDSPSEVKPLAGGITNVNLLLTDRERKYVVRLGSDIPEHGVMRFNELAISRAAHSAGISPKVVYAEPGAMVLDYVDAEPLTELDVQKPSILEEVVRLLVRVHTDVGRHLKGPVLTFWVFQVLRNYSSTLIEMGSRHAPKLETLMDEAEQLETCIGPIQLVLGHNDLLPGNILKGRDRLWLIDWEYGGFNSPLFDLGGLASNNSLTPDAEHGMLGAYFGREPDGDLLKRYEAMKCASLLRETMWSMVSEITSDLDFDYAAYTEENLNRFRKSMERFTRS